MCTDLLHCDVTFVYVCILPYGDLALAKSDTFSTYLSITAIHFCHSKWWPYKSMRTYTPNTKSLLTEWSLKTFKSLGESDYYNGSYTVVMTLACAM